MNKKELLAPAGSMEALKSAVHHGADAIYVGGKNFGARAFAPNFTDEELKEAASYCHLYDVKLYVTVNTMIYEEETELVLNYLNYLYSINVDAVIMADIGMIALLKEIHPDMEIHASTQLHTYSKEQFAFLSDLGVSRVVVDRELSLEEINNLPNNLEIEVFIHGALCACYSGECLFSSMVMNRSGNRGACAGLCRLPYELKKGNEKIDLSGKYIFSMKELNTMPYFAKLMDSNITSFKIEGRMKSPAYVGFVTHLYRKLIDEWEKTKVCNVNELDIINLKKLFNREFTTGYLFQDKDVYNFQSPNHQGVVIGSIIEVNSKYMKIKLIDDLTQNDAIRIGNAGFTVNYLYDKKENLIHQAKKGEYVWLKKIEDTLVGQMVLKTKDINLLNELEQYSLKKIPISMNIKANLDGVKLNIDDGINVVTIDKKISSLAIKRPITNEDIERQLKKIGDTPFELINLNITLDDNIFINLKDLNELRREGISSLIKVRKNNER